MNDTSECSKLDDTNLFNEYKYSLDYKFNNIKRSYTSSDYIWTGP